MASRSVFMFFIVYFFNLCLHVSPRVMVKDAPDIYPFDFFSRVDWGAEPSQDIRPLNLPVPYVVIHHTYIPGQCFSFAECSAAMRSMQTYHNSLDWGDIGYNFCVGSEGGVYEGRGWNNVGIHTGRANNHSIGICLIGDFRTHLPTAIQLKSTQKLIEGGVMLGKVNENYKLIGHNQVMATECPGHALLAEISTWDHYVHGPQEFSLINSS